MPDDDSRLQARYASIVLNAARFSDQTTALRLIDGLSRDLPLGKPSPIVIKAHYEAIAKFHELANALLSHHETSQHWRAALQAVNAWLDLVE